MTIRKLFLNFMLLNIGFHMLMISNDKIYALRSYDPYANLIVLFLTLLSFQKISSSQAFFASACLFYIALVSLFNGSSIGAASSFLSVFVYILCFESHPVSESFLSALRLMALVMFVLALSLSKTRYSVFLTGNYGINPNGVSMTLLIGFIFMNALERVRKKPLYPLFLITLYFVALYTISLLKSRTSFLGMLTYGALSWKGGKIFRKNGKVMILAFALVIILGCLFPIVYVGLKSRQSSFINVATESAIGTVTKVTSSDGVSKGLYSGREVIWGNFFSKLHSPTAVLFGIGSGEMYDIGQGLSMHNSFLGIIMNYGVIGLCLYLFFLLFSIKRLYVQMGDRITGTQYALLSGYWTLLLLSWAEVTFLTPYMILLTNALFGLALNPQFQRETNRILKFA